MVLLYILMKKQSNIDEIEDKWFWNKDYKFSLLHLLTILSVIRLDLLLVLPTSGCLLSMIRAASADREQAAAAAAAIVGLQKNCWSKVRRCMASVCRRIGI